MYSNTAAAEHAALPGHGTDWDTQQCQDLQNEILSSSPQLPTDAVASTTLDALVAGEIPAGSSLNPRGTVEASTQHPRPEAAEADEAGLSNHFLDVEVDGDREALNGESEVLPARLFVRCNSYNRRPSFVVDGTEAQLPGFAGKHHAQLAALAKMEETTQKSSMSPTQENSESAYEHFGLQRTTNAENDFLNSMHEEPAQQARITTNSFRSKHHSVLTDSTAYTYGENDAGHIKLDFKSRPNFAYEQESQDTSYALNQLEVDVHDHSYDPQTPAPPINPFSHKGSVMKGHELFGATQPSSLGRRLASPTSSRPSPDVYNDFTSPPQKRFLSSPLVRGPGINTSPLQSSVRGKLNPGIPIDSSMAAVQHTPGVQSFDLGPTIPSSGTIREPRAYRSMKESQEERRRMAAAINEQNSNSSDSDSSLESKPIKRRRTVNDDVKRQLAAVEVHRRNPSSSRPQISSPPVLVPSTLSGRRRSFEEGYIAQCDVFDAGDTEQDDVIADSQKLQNVEVPQSTTITEPDEPQIAPAVFREAPISMPKVPVDNQVASSTSISSSNKLNNTSDQNHLGELHNQSLYTGQTQELPINKPDLCTPKPSRHLQSDSTVPETSRAEDRIRPIGEVTSFTSAREQDDLQDVPGFTQDVEFENAIRMGYSPELLPANTSENPPSSDDTALSSPPATMVSETRSPLSGKRQPSPHPEEAEPVRQLMNTDGLNQIESPGLISQSGNNGQPSATVSKVNESTVTEPAVSEAKRFSKSLDSTPTTIKRLGLRTKAQLKGPSSSLRRNANVVAPTERTLQSRKISKNSPASKPKAARPSKLTTGAPVSTVPANATSQIVDRNPGIISSNKRSFARKFDTAEHPTPQTTAPQRTSNRRSGPVVINYNEDTPPPSSSPRRRPLARPLKESSEDPLALPTSSAISQLQRAKSPSDLFNRMIFAVSYVSHEQDKNCIMRLITKHSGRILRDGFDSLFEPTSFSRAKPLDEEMQLSLVGMAKGIGFAALIADEHSRKAKYMQALALGLPCISGQWISTCVSKNILVDWTPYLLCAGQSSVLGNAYRSRILQPYSPAEANLENTLATRDKLLEGKSILLVMGKGKAESRKAYVFLTQALGPTRIDQATDLAKARIRLIEAENEGQGFDLLYVDTHEEDAAAAVFGPTRSAAARGSRKRKRGPVRTDDDEPSPKKIRVISDEVIIQSLILGQLLDE